MFSCQIETKVKDSLRESRHCRWGRTTAPGLGRSRASMAPGSAVCLLYASSLSSSLISEEFRWEDWGWYWWLCWMGNHWSFCLGETYFLKQPDSVPDSLRLVSWHPRGPGSSPFVLPGLVMKAMQEARALASSATYLNLWQVFSTCQRLTCFSCSPILWCGILLLLCARCSISDILRIVLRLGELV